MPQHPSFERWSVTWSHSSTGSLQELRLESQRIHEPNGAFLRENLSETHEQIKVPINLKVISILHVPLQNLTLDILVPEGGNVLGWQTGLWSTEAKVWGIVPKAAWHWGGGSIVTNNSFGTPDRTPLCVCLALLILNYQGFQNNGKFVWIFLPWDISSNWNSKYHKISNYREFWINQVLPLKEKSSHRMEKKVWKDLRLNEQITEFSDMDMC
jgi:hypothetical protein